MMSENDICMIDGHLDRMGVRVNSVLPGAINTSMTAALSPEEQKRQLALIPIGRLGRPEGTVYCQP